MQLREISVRMSVLVLSGAVLAGCAGTSSWLPAAGPRTNAVEQAQASVPVKLVDLDGATVAQRVAHRRERLFSELDVAASQAELAIGPGDVLEVSIWEAPPAVLFASGTAELRGAAAGNRGTVLPEQMVAADGSIVVPFAGRIKTTGKTVQQVASSIEQALARQAHQPQVLVRMIRNNAANVTVVGEVAASTRMPLTSRGERLLDALAAAGGVRQPVNKVTMQLTRREEVLALPLESVIHDPRQNIRLLPGDVVTAMVQPLSFTVLGATGKNEEINFESRGISLVQALARAGGLQDARADAQGVFLFRMEAEPGQLAKAPVVYRLNLKDPAAFFAAQGFAVQNGDLLYVSNAPAVELQKFLNIVLSAVYPVANVVAVSK
jgi:polysaccharide export outer membrane protein